MSRARPWAGVAAPVPPKSYRRLAVFVTLLVLAFGAVAARLVDIQVVRGDELKKKAEDMHRRRHEFTPPRGRILDRKGNVLAYSRLVKTVIADPSLIGPTYAALVARLLAKPLAMTVEELTPLLAKHRRQDVNGRWIENQYVLLKRGVTYETWREIRRTLDNLDLGQNNPAFSKAQRKLRARLCRDFANAIATDRPDDQERIYPGGPLASHVVGFVGYNSKWDSDPTVPKRVGVEGLEYTMNSVLQGVPGWQVKRLIKRGGAIFYEFEENVNPRPGRDVSLALDSVIQGIVERELLAGFEAHRPRSISCVVVDPQTGEILALANLPTFDPNRYGESEALERRNRAITDSHEPGSTFKVITIGAAMDAGKVWLNHRVDCEGGVFRNGARGLVLHDLKPHDVLDVKSVIRVSSNIGAAKVALLLGVSDLYLGIRRFGIGGRTGIPLPAEGAGILREPHRWQEDISITRVPMGHEVAVTPIQMTMAMAAIANGGRLMRPILVKSVQDAEGRVVARVSPQMRVQAVSSVVARAMTEALQAVVEEAGGTGRQARLDHYTVAGKTGTADKYDPETGEWGRTHYASFVGFFPAERPQLCIGVFVDEPRGGFHYGGSTAAPIFREIGRQTAVYLGIPESPSRRVGVATRNLAQRSATPGLTGTRPRSRL